MLMYMDTADVEDVARQLKEQSEINEPIKTEA